MSSIINYYLRYPTRISSLILICNIPYTIYVTNYNILITQIPVGITSILLHWNINTKIVYLDIAFANLALIQHVYNSFYRGTNISNFFFLLSPILYILSKYKTEYSMNRIIHSFMHISLTFGTILLNKNYLNNFLSRYEKLKHQ